ncbi:MAG: hypothetical protein KKB50_02460, partial [Planctomycetes bacterium]|nr:hypothetical protein [Planctomycetota bacterium]
AGLRHTNSAAFLGPPVRASHNRTMTVMLKCSILYPARDILLLDPLGRRLFGDKAWNATADGVADSSFFTNRRPEDLTPERIARGPCTEPPPVLPFRIGKVKQRGGSCGFVGTDVRGRKFLVKLDHPDYPELGSAAAIIGDRVLWGLGYNVPPIYIVQIEGTGDQRFDGRRATAVRFLDGVQGHFHFDWFRYRRELRGLRLASAWINDTDRVGTNTLVVVRGGRASYYLIDFNSCLGSWQGRPKEPWRGWRHWCDLGWIVVEVFTLGLQRAEPDPQQPIVAPAVGRFTAEHFDPLRWRSQVPNNAFEHMTASDTRWIIERIRALDRPQIESIVAEARLSNPDDAAYLVETLLKRRQLILEQSP